MTVGADVTVGQVIGATPVHDTDTPSWTCHITIKYINNNEGIHYKEVGNTNLYESLKLTCPNNKFCPSQSQASLPVKDAIAAPEQSPETYTDALHPLSSLVPTHWKFKLRVTEPAEYWTQLSEVGTACSVTRVSVAQFSLLKTEVQISWAFTHASNHSEQRKSLEVRNIAYFY